MRFGGFCGHRSRFAWPVAAQWPLLVVLCCATVFAVARADTVVARVDDVAITGDEFRLFLGWHKADVARRLFPASPAVTAAMWTQARDGKSAADLLRDDALRDAIATKVRQLVYVDRGLTRHLEFPSIQAEFAAENGRRAKAVLAHAVVYGPRQWTLEAYYRHRDAELAIRLREALRADEIAALGPPAAVTPEALDRKMESLVRDRLSRAKISIDRAALASAPIP